MWISTGPEGDWKATLRWWEEEGGEGQHASELLSRWEGGEEGGSSDRPSAASEGEGGEGEDVEEGLYGFQRRISANPEQASPALPLPAAWCGAHLT